MVSMPPLEKMNAMAALETAKMMARMCGSHAVAGIKAKDGGYRGGRQSKTSHGSYKLSDRAERVLLCLQADMTGRALAQVGGTSHHAVSHIIGSSHLKDRVADYAELSVYRVLTFY